MSGATIALTGRTSAAASLDTQTVTVGSVGTALNADRNKGYASGLGSISDGTSNIYSGAAITVLDWYENGGSPDDYVELGITGTSLANSGWTTLTIGSTEFLRASATCSTAGGVTYWNWTNPGGNPFGTTGGNTSCVFT